LKLTQRNQLYFNKVSYLNVKWYNNVILNYFVLWFEKNIYKNVVCHYKLVFSCVIVEKTGGSKNHIFTHL